MTNLKYFKLLTHLVSGYLVSIRHVVSWQQIFINCKNNSQTSINQGNKLSCCIIITKQFINIYIFTIENKILQAHKSLLIIKRVVHIKSHKKMINTVWMLSQTWGLLSWKADRRQLNLNILSQSTLSYAWFSSCIVFLTFKHRWKFMWCFSLVWEAFSQHHCQV